MNRATESQKLKANWQMVSTLENLRQRRQLLVRVMGKQIALFNTASGVFACDNRCPHEGYPLSEGSISGNCLLTCNWHNWKFDLGSGENLFGGDQLRTYPVEISDNEIWVDIKDIPYAERYQSLLESLQYAFDHNNYDQIARESARLIRLGTEPMDIIRHVIDWSWARLEYGWSHAYAGLADWIQLYDENPDNLEIRLTCILEAIAHISYDVLREQQYPYSNTATIFVQQNFLTAIENEDENAATSMIIGGLEGGLEFSDFEEPLTQAALAHYNDFGHSLIYVTKAGFLIRRLGKDVARPLLLSLVRSIIFASREDCIPEFRKYHTVLSRWNDAGFNVPIAKSWYRKSINQCLETTLESGRASPQDLYRQLLVASAISMLGFDISQQEKVSVSVSGNVGWLSFTHALTFASAVRQQCSKYPTLWPNGLLQMSCFIGRNSAFTTKDLDIQPWIPENVENALAQYLEEVLVHGQGEHIVSVHLLKTTLAVREEATNLQPVEAEVLVAALNRFLHSPLKRRLPRRTAYQSLKFVKEES